MTVSERSRGPERSSGPAPTDQGSPSGSEDFYAAAAASVAGRTTGRRVGGGSNGQSGSAQAAPAQDRDKLTPKARPSEPKPAHASSPTARNDAGADTTPGNTSGSNGETEPTTLGAVASQVLNAVKPKTKAEKAEERAKNSGPAAELVRNQAQAPVPAKVAAAQPAKVAAAQPATAVKPKPGAARGTRKARLRLSRLDPWSVMKTSFMFSIAAGIVFVVAVFAVWTVIGSSGLFGSVDSIVGSVLQSPGDTTPFRIEDYVNTQKVMGVTAFLACIDVVIFTALATLASFLYNLAATMLGGLEVTLAED
jgi:hypothetical protein